jgi:hypothetical protein
VALELGQHGSLTILPEEDAPAAATVESLNAHRVRLRTGVVIAPGTPVRLDLDESLYLGEVSHCEPGGGGYLVSVELRHSLLHLPALHTLVDRLLGEEHRPEHLPEPQPVRVRKRTI